MPKNYDEEDVNSIYEYLIKKINEDVFGDTEQQRIIKALDDLIDWFGGMPEWINIMFQFIL